MTTTDRAARAALAWLAFSASAGIGDFFVQNDHCARIKGAHDDDPVIDTDPETGEILAKHHSAEGRRACAHHVATYTLTQAVALVAANKVTGAGMRPSRIAAALAVSAVTHYVADRRRPLKTLAHAIGKGAFYDRLAPICGSFELDQAWHRGCEGVAALIAAR